MMKKIKVSKSIVFLIAAPAATDTASAGPQVYLIGGIIALLIMIYIVYSLIRPEKF
jgi:K+-transporting ATPase KdpF subunit